MDNNQKAQARLKYFENLKKFFWRILKKANFLKGDFWKKNFFLTPPQVTQLGLGGDPPGVVSICSIRPYLYIMGTSPTPAQVTLGYPKNKKKIFENFEFFRIFFKKAIFRNF